MVKDLKITNLRTKQSVKLTRDGIEGFVIESVDWDEPAISFDTYRIPHQIGETISGQTIGRRNPTIIGYVISNLKNNYGTWDEYMNQQQSIIDQLKLTLDKVCCIFDELLIETNDYKLLTKVSSPVKYSFTEEENNEVLCVFYLQLTCEKPMFFKDQKQIYLASTNKKFMFPLIMSETKPVVFGEIVKKKSFYIENEGDIDCGCIIKIQAIGGTVVNPKVYNVESGEYFELENITINDGDYVVINTDIGKEDVYMYKTTESKEQSLIGNIKDGSVFFKIKRGTNLYAYYVASTYENNIDVSISFSEQYTNIKGM